MEKVRKGSHLTESERKKIAVLREDGWSPYRIGKELGRAANTIRNEIRRGTTTIIFNYFEKTMYFADTAQAVYERNRKRCRTPEKIQSCKEFINYVEEKVLKEKRSFAAVRAEALETGVFQREEVCSVQLLYNYTARGLIKVKNIDLPEKLHRAPRGEGKKRVHKRLYGVSIEDRPGTINNREEFGHWEIDLIIGKKKATDNVLLTLTERKTKKEIIRKIQGKKIDSVHKCLRRLQKEIPYFNVVFKSITTDNGTEFARLHELKKEMGIDVYYAHPYSSWERGLNENTNRIVRRFIPKGAAIKNYSKKQVKDIEKWINTLYRRSLSWRTAEECYQEELERLLKTA